MVAPTKAKYWPTREQAWAANLKAKYGLTPEDYKSVLAHQKNACDLCKKEFKGTPHVDHDHVTGKTRALLCPNCNVGLGKFFDSPAILWEAAKYVIKHRRMPLAATQAAQKARRALKYARTARRARGGAVLLQCGGIS